MKRFVTILAGLLTAAVVWAQSSIKVEVHNIVELSERFNVVFVVEGENSPSDFSWTPSDDFSLVWGPQKGTSTSISIMNGKTTKTTQSSYTYILQAKQTGSFTIPSATAKVKGKEIRSNPVTVKVVDNGSKGGQQPQASSGSSSSSAQQQSQQAQTTDADIFMRLTLSRNSVVVGEPVTATLKIYHRANLVGFENAKFPTFKGFWSQEVEAPSNVEFQREEVNGTVYNSALLRRWVIIPQKTGDVTIDPAEIVCLVNVQRRRSTGSIFDDFFGSDYATVRQRVYTSSPTLHVAALPAGAPASFGGGVGEFTVKARISKDTLSTHDAASLVVTVSGKGNIALLEAPKLNFPPDFEVYDVKSNTSGSATSGSKTFEYPFIPRSHGDFTIAPVKYSYYDVKARQYRTAQTDSLRLSVKKAAGSTAVQDSGTTLVVEHKGVKNLGEDIRFIRSKTTLGGAKKLFIDSIGYIVGVVLMMLAALAFWLGFREAAARRADIAGTLSRKATKQALKRLSQAKEFLQKDLYTAFYEELHRSLLGFVGDKLSMDMADQSKDNISSALVANGVPEATAADFVGLLEECEFARYSPDAGHEAMNAHYEKAVSTITAIDSYMKKGPSHTPAAVLALLLMLAPMGLRAQQAYPDSLWNAGVQAYTDGDFETALNNWEEVRSAGLISPELMYNLGNAYFKTGELGKAILWYERALKANPSDADAKYNLEYARALTQDRIDSVPEFFLETWGRNACHSLPSNTWAVLSLVFLALTLALVLLFLLGSTSGRRRLGFFAGIVAFLVTFVCWDFAGWQARDARDQSYAIVMKPVSSVGSSPSADSAKDLFILHEGTRVKILDNISGFSQIEIADGRQGWIQTKDIEVI